MTLTIYKGYEKEFFDSIMDSALVKTDIDSKFNALEFNKKTKKQLDRQLLGLDDDDSAWVTYEEFSLIKTSVKEAISDYDLKVVINDNNIYPGYYPCPFELDDSLAEEIVKIVDATTDSSKQSENCEKIFKIYSSLIVTDDCYYVGYYNYELDFSKESFERKNRYNDYATIEHDKNAVKEYSISLNEDVEGYLNNFEKLKKLDLHSLGYVSTTGKSSARLTKALLCYCALNNIRVFEISNELFDNSELKSELIDIAKNDLGISGFEDFRKIKFYKNPDVNKDTIDISQGQIIQDIITQAEVSYADEIGNHYRDIFITASTGAGKSVMFQIPAVYLAKKYNKLTIIIEPVKALMQDQKSKLVSSGYDRVETFNSDLITQIEKERVLKRIHNGEVDLLYLSPETLMSYSIDTIIGEREIGLLIVDEAHIVTTWGADFRPDYWYLGGYINRLRNKIQTSAGMKRKTYSFPICAFTATAINGGMDDSVSETIISLYMENPIKYIGYVKRDDIDFLIKQNDNGVKLTKEEYDKNKTRDFSARLENWIEKDEKTIVYFPYARMAKHAFYGMESFKGVYRNPDKIGIYTGKNIYDLNPEEFAQKKNTAFDEFRTGKKPIMFATKAFGMGVDVNDVKNVYHYAISGNLCDYVQEIGRAARKSDMEGLAITDNYYNDISFMNTLFGMSQIKQYQIKKVIEILYNTYVRKNYSRSFLISPESFTYIFNEKDEKKCVSKLKISLLMLEKDFYDEYGFKVIVSRPKGVFTKAFVCVHKEHEKTVLNSKYGKYLKFVEKGRYQERDGNNKVSDLGDIYSIDLAGIWEEYYKNISFPKFKYYYFNKEAQKKAKVYIMPSIRDYISPRQRISVQTRDEMKLSDLRASIIDDLTYIANELYSNYKNQYFTVDDFAKLLSERFGKEKASLIANSLFDLVDPDGKCVKYKNNSYTLSNGTFSSRMRMSIDKSHIVADVLSRVNEDSYSYYLGTTDGTSTTALKLLSIFDYISYDIVGGEEPEIFVRLNDPDKLHGIINGSIRYSNSYINRANEKHDRDVKLIKRFFNDIDNKDRWDFIEDYFLGENLIPNDEIISSATNNLSTSIDVESSYKLDDNKQWDDLLMFFEDYIHPLIATLRDNEVPIPQFLKTVISDSDMGEYILMSWPEKNLLIYDSNTPETIIERYKENAWKSFSVSEFDLDSFKTEVFG